MLSCTTLLRTTACAALLALAACQQGTDQRPDGVAASSTPTAGATAAAETGSASATLARADADMRAVLEALQGLGPEPIATLSAEEARQQPTVADAVMAVLEEQGRSTAPEPMASVEDITISTEGEGGAAAAIPARVYVPTGGSTPMPVIVYYHGGGWVIADLDTYDASARALAKDAGAIVVSSHYRQAPENKFPAAHDDAFAAHAWTLENPRRFGGDPSRVAVAGESAGGNMAAGVSMLARQHGLQAPVHQVLIYPVAGTDTTTPSYQENADAVPLNMPAMEWFFDKYLRGPEDMQEPLLNLVDAPDLDGMPPTTIVTAEIDPLRSEGQALADRLRQVGIPVEAMNYEGVTHEFFGTGAVVADARAAQQLAGQRLREAFAQGS
jgi:acetyl esterase/lipase